MKSILMAVTALALMCSFNTKPNSFIGDSFNYTNEKMHFQLSIPIELKDKMLTEESENSVVFRYANNGASPVFLFSINRVSSNVWMQVKETISNIQVLFNSNDSIIYSEKTTATNIKGKNKAEFASLASRVDEIVKSYR